MTGEIKELLFLLHNDRLTNSGKRKLEDYITNLQQENEEYSMIFDTFSKRPYAHKYLEEKKKKLNNNKIICLDSEMVYKDYYDYKSRCEKAMELLKLPIVYETHQENGERDELLKKIRQAKDILNGSDDK